jgi:superfamily II DNA/RNA helicase
MNTNNNRSDRSSSSSRGGNFSKRTSSSENSSKKRYSGSSNKPGSSSRYNRSKFSGSSTKSSSSSRSGGNRPGGSKFGGNRSKGGRSGGGSKGGGNRRGGGRKMSTFDPSQFINQNPVEMKVEEYVAKNTFTDFRLHKEMTRTISKMGLITPTPIQDQIIPEILKGNDVIGLAETGTGKTAAFLIPIIEKTTLDKNRQTLILTPTRELAIQVNDEFMKLSNGLQLYSTTCVGGMNIHPQIKSLRRTNHFIIGTPGRILDLIKKGNFKAERVSTVVLDEADRMLDMGFITDIKEILSNTPKDRETLFFSATMNAATDKIVDDFMKNPVRISVKKKDVTNSIQQDVVRYNNSNKFKILLDLLQTDEFKKVIIFGSMKHSVEKLSKELASHGIRSESIHGNKNHVQRQRALRNFKDLGAQVLVATDVAARGIHVNKVSHVINYDLPSAFDDYVHRIGRTGRANEKGKALTFIPEHM